MSQVLGVLWQTAKTAVSGSARHGSVAPKGSHSHLLRWIMSLGGVGIFVMAVVDSSVIPIPLPGSTDLLLLLLTSQRGSTAWSAVWLAICAFCGSMIGGYLAWSAGRKGGEVALERYVPKRFLARITGWMEKHGALSVGIATILPPPVPLMPFVVASGALGVSRGQFLGFYSIARVLRYGFLAWFGVTYGRHVVRVWLRSLGSWWTTLLWIYIGLVVVGTVYGIWKFRKSREMGDTAQPPAEKLA